MRAMHTCMKTCLMKNRSEDTESITTPALYGSLCESNTSRSTVIINSVEKQAIVLWTKIQTPPDCIRWTQTNNNTLRNPYRSSLNHHRFINEPTDIYLSLLKQPKSERNRLKNVPSDQRIYIVAQAAHALDES